MMIFFSLYFPILLSLFLSFILHTFKKHNQNHHFLALATTNATEIYKLYLKCHHPSTYFLVAAKPHPPLPPPIGFLGARVQGLITCIDERRVDDDDDHEIIEDGDEIGDNNSNDEDEDDYWKMMRETFPPPLSSLNGNGQPSFIFLPVRENGRLQLTKVRVKQPEILHASRQDGRLRLYLVPDQVEQEESEGEEEELTDEEKKVEVESQEEEEEIEEIRYNEEEDRFGEGKFPKVGNEGFRRCPEVMNLNHIQWQCHHYHVHGSHHHHQHLYLYGVSIT